METKRSERLSFLVAVYELHIKYLGYRLRRKHGKKIYRGLQNIDNLVQAFALNTEKYCKCKQKYSLDQLLLETRPCLITFSTLAIEKVLFMFLS